MADVPTVDVEVAPMADIPPMTLRFTEAGVVQVAAMIAYLEYANEELLQALTHVQTISTQQVERIRLLEAQVARLTGMKPMSEEGDIGTPWLRAERAP